MTQSFNCGTHLTWSLHKASGIQNTHAGAQTLMSNCRFLKNFILCTTKTRGGCDAASNGGQRNNRRAVLRPKNRGRMLQDSGSRQRNVRRAVLRPQKQRTDAKGRQKSCPLPLKTRGRQDAKGIQLNRAPAVNPSFSHEGTQISFSEVCKIAFSAVSASILTSNKSSCRICVLFLMNTIQKPQNFLKKHHDAIWSHYFCINFQNFRQTYDKTNKLKFQTLKFPKFRRKS